MLRLNRLSLRGFDWPLLAAIFLLCAIGFAAIYSVDLSRGAALIYTKKQMIAFFAGAICLLVAGFTSPSFFKFYAKWIYATALLLLLAVLFFGHAVRGTTGWFSFGGFSFQPVEFAKYALILMFAYVAVNFGRRFEKPLFFFGTGFIAALPVFLTLLQPDLGSAILLCLIWFFLVWLLGARRLYLLILILTVAGVAVFAWYYLLVDYQKERILTFVDPTRDPLGSGYNTLQSTIAVGSGGWIGRGLGFGSQSQLRFLPETQTDFVFSVVSEELGLAGASALLVLYLVIFWRLIRLVRRAGDDFAATTTILALVLFFSQFLINIGANIGLLPVTGVTLPFVSYGGSSLTVNLLLIGTIISLNKRYT